MADHGSKNAVKNAYNRWSATYDDDRNLTRDLDERITRGILGSRFYQRTLEIGSGTGKNTPLLSQTSGQVLAMDFSPGMLRSAKVKTAGSNVLFCQADLTMPWPLKSETVDRIVCNLVLEHIADLSPVFSEAQRTLQPGGILFVSELHPFRQYEGTRANFTLDLEQVEIPAFVHHVSDFLQAGKSNRLSLVDLQEWWHPEDENKPPRIITLLFSKIQG